MPELAAAGALGFLVCWLFNAVFIYFSRRQFRSAAYLNVQANLRKVGMFWSDHRSQILAANVGDIDASIAEDEKKSIRSLLIVCAGAAFASWAGLAFMILFAVSLRKLARPRLERQIMSSELATNAHLEPDVVEQTRLMFL